MNHEMIVAFHIIGHTILFISHKPTKSCQNPLFSCSDFPLLKTEKARRQ